jgi:acyl-CoA thioester hydrolase
MSGPLPQAGTIEGREHLFAIRVYYEDTDAGGIVYHANYLRFAERARTDFLRVIGWPHTRMAAEEGLSWIVRRAEVDFRRAARLDDALVVVTRLLRIEGARLFLSQIIKREGEDLAALVLQLAVLTDHGRPSRLPCRLVETIRPFLAAAESPCPPCRAR